MQTLNMDVVIFGGGVVGLLVAQRLRAQGYQAILLESTAIGSGQTIQSQGIIHGGIKYALKGSLTRSASQIEQMPERWLNCLLGKGEVDLSSVNILSNYHYLWATGQISSRLSSFFANKLLSSHSELIARDVYPTLFNTDQFKGKLYRVAEQVLDVPSLLHALAKPLEDSLYKINALSTRLNIDSNESIRSIEISQGNRHAVILPKLVIFAAGEGNRALLHECYSAPKMQCRPLHMVMLTDPTLTAVYAHCIGVDTNPRLTITTHTKKNGETVWYLGGQIAEKGINRDAASQIHYAQSELSSVLPWLALNNSRWASFYVNRAEGYQQGNKRPESATVYKQQNKIVAWPTKLAFAPLCVDNIMNMVSHSGLMKNTKQAEQLVDWARPELALPPWEMYL